MPEIKAIKHKATVNAFDFNFFSRSVIRKLQEIGIPKIVEGKLVDDELLFKF